MNKICVLFQLCAFMCVIHGAFADQSFVISKNVDLEAQKKNNLREKKYSELQEDLICVYEEVLRLQIEKLHELAQAQKACINALKKSIENVPQLSRDRIKKELLRLEKLKTDYKNMVFF